MEKFKDMDEAKEQYPESRYLILTDEEADDAVFEYIVESLWAFRPEFLSSETDLPVEVFEALSKQYEGANEPIRKLVEKTCGLQPLVDAAISADGRGHFLATYDCEEVEIKIGDEDYYVYRTN